MRAYLLLMVTVLFWLGVAPVRATEPACPAGEITLSAKLLAATHNGPGADRLATSSSSFVLPPGVSIDPASEAVSLVVEGDHRLLYQADIPAGGLSARSGDSVFAFRSTATSGGIGAGSGLDIRRSGAVFRMRARFNHLDIAGLETPPHFAKLLVKIGDDCFSAVLVCNAYGRALRCVPERSALLRGHVVASTGEPLAGTMLTAFDDDRVQSVSVFAQEDGHFVFPRLRPGTYRLRARLLGWQQLEVVPILLSRRGVTTQDFTLAPLSNANDQLPASQFLSLLLPQFPTPTTRGDFTLSCGNCHQIAGPRFRANKGVDEWTEVVAEMQSFLPPYHPETRPLILPILLDTFGPDAALPKLPVPPPPSGDVLRATLYEYGLPYGENGSTDYSSCHDLQLGTDGVVYNDSGIIWIDPRTNESGVFPMDGGGHSIQRDQDGNMWMTQPGRDTITKLDVHTGLFTYYPLPKIGDDQGAYPHTLRFDAAGNIWFTLSKTNHVARFVPATGEFTYYRLPPADPAEIGLSIPIPYGCDVAPDGTIWFSQLFGQRIGRIDPATSIVTAWKPPFYGPRRLRVGADDLVWVPGYGSGVLGRFDPAIERWKVYDLPTGIAGPPGYGKSEEPYALNVNRQTGDVWITGSASDTLIQFQPRGERFNVYPVPTRGSFMREIVFDPDGNPWTCTSDEPDVKEGLGRGKFVKIELPPKTAVCGNGVVEPGEECDDGNSENFDRCSNTCTAVTGCGDGVLDSTEQCDDGNTTDCDGCSSACVSESGLRCGDGMTNSACGEQCDPPAADRCDAQCQRIPYCGDGTVDPGEECDDGNANECDGCSNACRLITGCGDGVVCGTEECDDGNTDDCDGCSATCAIESGIHCGDGSVNATCGEECDPPAPGMPECNYLCRLGPPPALGTRRFSFGGSSYTSALGTTVPFAALSGAFDLVGGIPDPAGVAPVTVAGPAFYAAPLLGGAYGTLCFRITSCTGSVDCDGGTAVGVQLVQDSAGPGVQNNPVQVTAGLGGDGGPGAVLLACQQSFVQVGPGPVDCSTLDYPPDQTGYYTTGNVEGHYLNGNPRIGPGEISLTGENLSCAAWSTENGPGVLAAGFLIEEYPEAGDTANINLLDD